MKCSGCGYILPDDARFCMKCGAKVEAEQPVERNAFESNAQPVRLKLCPGCNSQATANEMYCRRCGTLLQERWLTGKKLLELNGAAFYKNFSVLSHSQATGDLTIYEDRIFFEKKLGGSLGRAFGLVGYIVSQNKMKEDPTDEYHMREISGAVQGDAVIKGTLLTITLKNGESFSFVNPKDKIAEAVKLIEEYRKYY